MLVGCCEKCSLVDFGLGSIWKSWAVVSLQLLRSCVNSNSQHRRYQALASQSHPITCRKQSQYRRSQTVYDADYPDLTEKTFPNIVGARL